MDLYPLGGKDIEAIGKARANRSLPQNVKNWMYGGIAVAFGGIIYWMFASGGWISIGIMAVGAVLVWYASTLSDKWRKKVITELKRQWRDEHER